MITEKHENSVYVKRGDSIAEYSQITYDQIMKAVAGTSFKDMHDIAALFIPGNASVICRSDDVSNLCQTPADVMFTITPGEKGMSIKSGYITRDFKKDHPYMLKPNPKSILANSGTIKIDGSNTLVQYGPKTSLPVVLIKNDDGISIIHETGKELYAEVMLGHGMTRKIRF